MGRHFNNLTAEEDERLAMLTGECGETINEASKVQRHGYDSYHPDEPDRGNNRTRLLAELVDIFAVYQMMMDAGDIEPVSQAAIDAAKERKLKYAHHQTKRQHAA